MKLFLKNTVRTLTLMLAFALFLTLFSCADGTQTEQGGENAEYISYVDALGRELSLKKNPERVAALLGSFADVWTLAGGELCAAAGDAWEDFGLELADAVNIGGAHSPSLELLISSAPELVIASASTASNVEMKDSLESMGIAVVYFDVDNFYDYLEMLRVCTELTGRKDLYEQNGLNIKTQVEAIKAQYAAEQLPESDRRVLLLRASSTTVKAKGSEGTVLGEMLADMGCINIADSDTSLLENLSVEAVIKSEPRHVFVVTMGSDTDKAKASLDKMMEENPAWGTLEAVKNGRIYLMDKVLFNLKPNDRFAEAYGKLYETLTEK